MRLFQKRHVERIERRKNAFWFQNHEAAEIIRNFITGNMKHDPYAWDDLMSMPHTNPDVVVAVELINEFDRRFPARHRHEYCAPEAHPYFLAIADLLEQGTFGIKDKLEIESTKGEYSPKMKELLECVEKMVSMKTNS